MTMMISLFKGHGQHHHDGDDWTFRQTWLAQFASLSLSLLPPHSPILIHVCSWLLCGCSNEQSLSAGRKLGLRGRWQSFVRRVTELGLSAAAAGDTDKLGSKRHAQGGPCHVQPGRWGAPSWDRIDNVNAGRARHSAAGSLVRKPCLATQVKSTWGQPCRLSSLSLPAFLLPVYKNMLNGVGGTHDGCLNPKPTFKKIYFITIFWEFHI